MKKCTYTNKVVLVQPIGQQNAQREFFMKPLESDVFYVNEQLMGDKNDNLEEVEVSGESVVVDEIIVTDDIGNDIMLPGDSFSLESAF